MFKYVRYGFIVLCLALFCGTSYAKFIDFEVTAQPTFTNLHRGDIQSGDYTIRNNVPNAVEILSIGIEVNDDKPPAASAIVAAPTNSCVVGTDLASGATCNIRLNLQPLALGDYNRRLKIGINTRQPYLYGNAITASVVADATPPSPEPPPTPDPAKPAPTPAPADQYKVSILAQTGVTNTGYSVVNGDLDLPVLTATSLTGFPPGTITGDKHFSDATAIAARQDALDYYNSGRGLSCDTNLTGQDLGGKTLAPGVYCFDSSAQLTGALTLAGTGSDSSYTFQIGSTLTTANDSSVVLTGGVVNDNVSWIVGSSATLGIGTAFQGIIAADISITLNTGASLIGRAWALNGAVTLDDNAVNPN